MNIIAANPISHSISAARQDPRANSVKGSPESPQAAKNQPAEASGNSSRTTTPDYDEYIPSGEKPAGAEAGKYVSSSARPEDTGAGNYVSFNEIPEKPESDKQVPSGVKSKDSSSGGNLSSGLNPEKPESDKQVPSGINSEDFSSGGNFSSGLNPNEPESDKQVPSGKKPEKPEEEKCTTNTDKVDAEIEKLRKAKEALERQIQQAADDPEKCPGLEQKLAQVEQELAMKDNDSYRKQHAVYTNS